MSTTTLDPSAPSTRRDRRFELGPGCIAEFHDPRPGGVRVRAALRRISASGVALEIPGKVEDFQIGQTLSAVTLTVRHCRLQGDVVVKNARPVGEGLVEIGGIFLPASQTVVDRLMAVIAGIEAVASAAD